MRDASTWTFKYRYWLSEQSFDYPALTTTFTRYRATVECRQAELEALEADLAGHLQEEPFATPVGRLSAYRGVDRLGALVLQAEVCDWRRFTNGAAAGAFCGLVPSEYSSGDSVRRGSLTHAGNAHLRRQLIESAWAYTTGPSLGVALRRRQDGVSADTQARAWASQVELCRRFKALTSASQSGAWSSPPSPDGSSPTSTPRWWPEPTCKLRSARSGVGRRRPSSP